MKLTFQHGKFTFEAETGSVLAQGGGGVVYEARCIERDPGDRVPPLLIVKCSKHGAEAELELEKQACEQVAHPGLVSYLGHAESAELGMFLAFEQLSSNALLVLNNEGVRPRFRDPKTFYYPLPPGRVLELAFDLLLSLEYLHSRGFVHSDVKLANLLLRTPDPTDDPKRLLEFVARGQFEAVLIDLGSLRSVEFLERLSRGEDVEQDRVPALTPVYAPPECLLELSAFDVRRHYSPAMDVYAFGLIFYVALTGRIPYDHVLPPEELKDPAVLLDLKLRESRGEIAPVDFTALAKVPLHDVAFNGPAATYWPAFHASATYLLETSTREARTRITASDARSFFEDEFRMTPSGSSGTRSWTQRTFQMVAASNRLVTPSPTAPRGFRLREVRKEVEVAERDPRPPARMPRHTATSDGGPVHFRDALKPTRAIRKATPSTRLRRTKPVPLTSVLRPLAPGEPLPVRTPVLLSRLGLTPRDFELCKVVPLGGEINPVVRLGRGRENELVVADTSVSRLHAELRRDEKGVWSIVDLGSSNGTVVNGEFIKAKTPVALEGQLVTIGLGRGTQMGFAQESELKRYLASARDVWTKTSGGRVEVEPGIYIEPRKAVSLSETEAGPAEDPLLVEIERRLCAFAKLPVRFVMFLGKGGQVLEAEQHTTPRDALDCVARQLARVARIEVVFPEGNRLLIFRRDADAPK